MDKAEDYAVVAVMGLDPHSALFMHNFRKNTLRADYQKWSF